MAELKTKTLPYNLEAEQSLLGSILIDVELQSDIISSLEVDDFCVESHKLIFQAITTITNENKTIDVVTLVDELNKPSSRKKVNISKVADTLEKQTNLERIGGLAYLTDIAKSTPSAANYEEYLKIVKRDSLLRKLIRVGDLIINKAKTETDSTAVLSFAEKSIYDISEKLETTSLINLNENTSEVLELFANIQKDKNYNQGINTGFTEYDRYTNGLHKGNLVILAARPAVGKSTLAMNMVSNMAIKSNAVCAVFSLEMTRAELTERMLCSVGSVNGQNARKGNLSTDDWKKLWDAQKTLQSTNIFIDDTAMTTVPMILSKCRRLKAQKGRLDVVVVDHMQLMNAVTKSESRQSEITEISRGLKMVAKELDCPVIALSQLSRAVEKRTGSKPVLSDLRESGSIEQDADLVMFIHRQELSKEEKEKQGNVNEGLTEIIIAKNRSGPTGSFNLIFKGSNNKFINYYTDMPNEPNFKPFPKNDGLVKVASEPIIDDNGDNDDSIF